MLELEVRGGELHFDASVTIRFMRMPARAGDAPVNGAMLREFPFARVADYARRVPAAWRRRDGLFMSLSEAESFRIDFSARPWKPNVVKVGAGRINAISGQRWNEGLSNAPQDYLVVPDQASLSMMNLGSGRMSAFSGASLLSGHGDFRTLRLLVIEPKPGQFLSDQDALACWDAPSPAADSEHEAAWNDGPMHGRIWPDGYGVDTWDLANTGQVHIHVVTPRLFREITGHAPQPEIDMAGGCSRLRVAR